MLAAGATEEMRTGAAKLERKPGSCGRADSGSPVPGVFRTLALDDAQGDLVGSAAAAPDPARGELRRRRLDPDSALVVIGLSPGSDLRIERMRAAGGEAEGGSQER